MHRVADLVADYLEGKAAIVLGLGQENVRRVASDEAFRMSVPALEEAIARDRAEGRLPMAVATVGTTSPPASTPCPRSPTSAPARGSGFTWTPPMPAWPPSAPSTGHS